MRSGDETTKHPTTNSMVADRNELCLLMEGGIFSELDNRLIITKH